MDAADADACRQGVARTERVHSGRADEQQLRQRPPSSGAAAVAWTGASCCRRGRLRMETCDLEYQLEQVVDPCCHYCRMQEACRDSSWLQPPRLPMVPVQTLKGESVVVVAAIEIAAAEGVAVVVEERTVL